MIFSCFSDFQIDGYVGVLVAIFIIFFGITLLKSTISPLLGELPDPSLEKSLKEKIMSYKAVLGIYDFVLHNYGSDKMFANADVEVSANSGILTVPKS